MRVELGVGGTLLWIVTLQWPRDGSPLIEDRYGNRFLLSRLRLQYEHPLGAADVLGWIVAPKADAEVREILKKGPARGGKTIGLDTRGDQAIPLIRSLAVQHEPDWRPLLGPEPIIRNARKEDK